MKPYFYVYRYQDRAPVVRHPRVDQFAYLESKQTRTDAFLEAALSFVRAIKGKKGTSEGDEHTVI